MMDAMVVAMADAGAVREMWMARGGGEYFGRASGEGRES